jgi:hypothetical protein
VQAPFERFSQVEPWAPSPPSGHVTAVPVHTIEGETLPPPLLDPPPPPIPVVEHCDWHAVALHWPAVAMHDVQEPPMSPWHPDWHAVSPWAHVQ